jgi:hypothetical protein
MSALVFGLGFGDADTEVDTVVVILTEGKKLTVDKQA